MDNADTYLCEREDEKAARSIRLDNLHSSPDRVNGLPDLAAIKLNRELRIEQKEGSNPL